MKLLFKVLLTLIALVVAVFGLSYQLPRESVAEKSMLVPASPEQVFIYLENPMEWVHWNAWNKSYDPTMIQLYGGPMRGKGARLTWNGDKLGRRQMVFTNSESPATLEYEITQEKEAYKTTGGFSLEKTEGGTLVHWRMHTPLQDNPVALIYGTWQQYRADKEMEQGLLGLKALVEKNSIRRATR